MFIKSKKQGGFTRSLRNSLAPAVFTNRHSNRQITMLSEIFSNYLIWHKKPRLFSSAGFTLIEVVIVLAILAIIGGAIFTFQRDIFFNSSVIQSGAIAENNLQNVLRQFIGEARGVRPATTGAYAIDTAATSTFIFYSDIDSDNQPERVRYFLADGNFKRGVVNPTGSPAIYDLSEEKIKTIATDVINGPIDIFSYFGQDFNGSGDPLAQPVDVAKIRLVKINIGFDPNPARPFQPMWISSVVMLRNLKHAL